MKKALSLLSTIGTTFAITLAQINVSVGNVGQQGQVNDTFIVNILTIVKNTLGALVPIVILIAVLSLFWFLITYIWLAKEDPEKQQKATKGIGLSLLAIFVMVSLWGIIGLVGSFFGVGQGNITGAIDRLR